MSDHLQIMGIERWCLRSQAADPPCCQSIKQVFYYCLASPPTVALIADADQHNPEQASLMLAIVKAMQQPFEGAYYAELALETLPDTIQEILWLGSCAVSDFLQKPVTVASERGEIIVSQNRQMRITHSLQAMLDNKKLKAETWQDLQALTR